jgi:hypothetical protein
MAQESGAPLGSEDSAAGESAPDASPATARFDGGWKIDGQILSSI